MARERHSTELGTLHLYGWRAEAMRAAMEIGLEAARRGVPDSGFRSLDGTPIYFKGEPLRGRARVRHALRHHVLGRRLPRVEEYYNLSWLVERLFQAALPLAAGALFHGGSPRYQFLVTREIEGARTMRAFLESGEPGRAEVLDELARELARMHALRFVHRDLFPRNLLVGPPGSPRRVHFLDAWRGGPRPQLRGPSYDLACFMLRAPELLDPAEQRRFFERYVEERRAQGRPAPRRLAASVARERAALVRRLVRRPELLRGRPLPPASWRLDPSA